MESAAPPGFGDAFLDWFRQRTEAAWATYATPTLQHFVELRMLGCEWQPGTRWLGGLEDEQLAAVEREYALRFPPDDRYFLHRLHAVDRPLRCTAWEESTTGTGPRQTLRDGPAFYNCLTEGDVVRRCIDDLVTGLQFDVEEIGLWRPDWGYRPVTPESRAQRVRELVVGAPRLIPVYRNRYLLAEPCQAGNPVFSVMQSDIIVYGADLHTYFLVELADLLDIDAREVRKQADTLIQARFPEHAAIPFWGDLYANY